MKTLAIITARGGSKRIPRKNIKEFCGKPIMAYSVEACVQSGVFDTVMVSTEDEEIAQIGKKYGAQVPFYRSEKTAGDFANTNDVIDEVIAEYEKRGEFFDFIACIYPTAPFITAERIRDAVNKLSESDADSLIPVVGFSFPPQRGMEIVDGCLRLVYPQYRDTRSQDLTPHYHDAGQFYIMRTESYKKTGRIMAGKILPFVLSEMEVQDIDNPVDWELAELKYKLIHNER